MSPVIYVLFLRGVHYGYSVDILASVPTLRKHFPLIDSQFALSWREFLTWHVVALIQENQLENRDNKHPHKISTHLDCNNHLAVYKYSHSHLHSVGYVPATSELAALWLHSSSFHGIRQKTTGEYCWVPVRRNPIVSSCT